MQAAAGAEHRACPPAVSSKQPEALRIPASAMITNQTPEQAEQPPELQNPTLYRGPSWKKGPGVSDAPLSQSNPEQVNGRVGRSR